MSYKAHIIVLLELHNYPVKTCIVLQMTRRWQRSYTICLQVQSQKGAEMKFWPRFSKFKLWNGFPLFSVFGGLYLNLLKSSLTDFFKSLFSVLKTQFIHTFIQNHLLYTCSIPGPLAINWGIEENKARSSSHRRGSQQTREQIKKDHKNRERNG